ncbi:type II secretion system protein [Leeia aquatica]|uniref:Prepilin-type N-terminal cleavage/methylation domain-containing protein n=1 Tax=Leeia aquatica TaxID=2725557 RepID=A0A847RX67_9NEIS|nr:prepilin-type N-terminal cleavage/methylation domain-containing protein [Leeia aquatica]NLR75750.1 prepilin-type N-terminal cleavage/methylation domain-containing protein [Leeia aquatica]
MTGKRGFTLIELLVALAIVGLLLAIVAPRYFGALGKSEETVLRSNLALTRNAIDQFHADKGRYPASLQELVDLHYLRSLPMDPILKRDDAWQMVTDSNGQLRDLHSAATTQANDGTRYNTW